MRKLAEWMAALLLWAALVPCAAAESKRYETSFLDVFDTFSQVVVYADTQEAAQEILQTVHDELKVYHRLFDIYQAYEGVNNLYTVNQNAGIAPVAVEQPLYDLLTFGKEIYAQTGGKTIYFITAWRTPLDTWRGALDETGGAPNTHSANDRTQREADALQGVLAKAESARTLFTLDAANCAAVYYSQNNGQDDVLLCGSMNGGIISLPRLALGYYVLLSLALLITLGIAFFACRRKKTGKVLGYLALIPASYLAGHLLVKGFTTTSYQMQRDFSLIILAAALIYAAVMLAINLWRQKREKV